MNAALAKETTDNQTRRKRGYSRYDEERVRIMRRDADERKECEDEEYTAEVYSAHK